MQLDQLMRVVSKKSYPDIIKEGSGISSDLKFPIPVDIHQIFHGSVDRMHYSIRMKIGKKSTVFYIPIMVFNHRLSTKMSSFEPISTADIFMIDAPLVLDPIQLASTAPPFEFDVS